MASDERKTAYSIIVYPDSTDIEALRDYLRGEHVRACLSPLHDKDVYDSADVRKWEKRQKEGTLEPEYRQKPIEHALKKPHYHLLLSFGRVKKSPAQVLSFLRPAIPTVAWAEPVVDLHTMTRYQCHLDEHGDKALYSIDECESFCGYDLSPLYAVTKGEKRSSAMQICQWCETYHIYDFVDLVQLCIELGDPSLFDTAREYSYFFKTYMESLLYRSKYEGEKLDVKGVAAEILFDRNQTGEIQAGKIEGESKTNERAA